MADETLPNVGEVRTANGETRRWNGHGWELLPRTFLGTEDFSGRVKDYAGKVVPTMLKDYAQPVLHPLDTIGGLVGGVAHTAGQVAKGIRHPLTPQDDLGMISDAGRTVRSMIEGDPEAAGHVLAAVSAPKVYDKALGGVNKAAHAVAESPAARSAAGYALGAGGSIATGIGHPFMGAVVGRMASSLLEKPAAELASITDRIRNAIHGPTEGAPPPVDTQLLADYESIKKNYGQTTADNWLKSQKPSPAATNPSGASKPAGGGGSAPSGAKAPTGAPQPPSGGGPGVYPGGPRTFYQRPGEPPSETPPGPSRGQPVMPKAGDGANVINDATGETEAQWRARMQDRINKASESAKGAKNPTRTPAPKTSASSTGRIPDAPADMASVVDRMAGGPDAPPKGNGTSTTTLQEDISNLRRKYGADRIARQVRPDAPEVANGAITRNDMDLGRPAQSWMPDIAQEALLRDLKAGATKDPSKTLRALSQALKEYKRNGGSATSPVAKELQQMLKAHGFITE